jgi:hypothetical protein
MSGRSRVGAAAAAVTGVMTALATLTAAYGMEAGLLALVFAVVVTSVGALTYVLLQQITGPSDPGPGGPTPLTDEKKRSTA